MLQRQANSTFYNSSGTSGHAHRLAQLDLLNRIFLDKTTPWCIDEEVKITILTSRIKERQKKNLTTRTYTSPLKLAYNRKFWLVSRKGRRRPFCPDDEWTRLTGHFSLTLTLFHSLSLLPCVLFSGSCLSSTPHPPSLTQSHNLLPQTRDQETDSTGWQIYWHQHEVKHLKPSVTPEDPLPERQDWSTIYIYWGPTKGQLLYISATWDCISQKIAHTSLSSWKARIILFFKTCVDFFHNVSSLLNRWVYEPYVWDFPLGPEGGKAGSHFHPGQHTYRPMSGSWLEVCSDRFHRCNNPSTPPHPYPSQPATKPPHTGTIINPGLGLTQRRFRPMGGPHQSTHTYTHAHTVIYYTYVSCAS